MDFLTKLANESETVRDYLGVKNWKNISKVLPNAIHMDLGNGQTKGQFTGNRKDLGVSNILMRFAKEGVFKHLDRKYGYSDQYMFQDAWKPALVKYGSGSFNSEIGGGGANVTCDGNVYDLTSRAWSVARGLASGSASSTTGANASFAQLNATTTTDEWFLMARSYFTFDTSSIGAGQQVKSGSFSMYGTSAPDDFGLTAELVTGSLANDNNVVVGDFSAIDYTRMATGIAIGSWNTSGNNVFTLNGAGQSNVNMIGVSTFAGATSADVDNSEPTWASGNSSAANGYFADQGSNEPTLALVWGLPGKGGTLSMLGV